VRLQTGGDRQWRHLDPLLGKRPALGLRCDTPYAARGRFVIMDATRFFGKTVADIDRMRHQLAGNPDPWRRHGGLRVGRRRTRARQIEPWRRKEFRESATFAHRACDLTLCGLRYEIFLRGKPTLEAMAMLTAEIVDFHGIGSRAEIGNQLQQVKPE